jgi:N-acetylglucosamine malate deacetylase 1
MAPSPVDVLALSPHPDDVEIGCGGTLILSVAGGLRVAIADLTRGEASTRGTPAQRDVERREAARRLGIETRLTVGLPDGRLGVESGHRLALIRLIRELRPEVVLAPYWEDRHPDHAAAGALAREACFFAGCGRIGEGPPHRPRHLYHYMLHQPFAPSFVVDVSAVWEQRQGALAAYRSQFTADLPDHPTALSSGSFLRAVEARAIEHGAMIGAAYGEPFLAPGPLYMSSLPRVDTTTARGPPAYRMFL